MIKRKITETVEEYDKDGKVVRKTTTETEETDETPVQRTYPFAPLLPYWGLNSCGWPVTCSTDPTDSLEQPEKGSVE